MLPPPVPLLPIGILTQYLSVYQSKEQQDAVRDLQCIETAARVDVIDAWAQELSDVWRQFRAGLDRCFVQEFGLRLSYCCRIPTTNQLLLLRQYYS